jgi:hypothetical protein
VVVLDRPKPVVSISDGKVIMFKGLVCSSCTRMITTPAGEHYIREKTKISGHQQRWHWPLRGAILIPPALLVAADFCSGLVELVCLQFHGILFYV